MSALQGLRVVDFTWWVAGPTATKLLADQGATVIKIELPGRGDPARAVGPFPADVPDRERSGLFLDLNTGKKSVTLDLKHRRAGEIVRSLVAGADVIVESFRPGTLARLGFDHDALFEIKRSLVICSISSFGQTGPYRDRSATELVIQSMAGYVHASGDPAREPLWMPINLAQQLAGVYAYIGILAARRAAAASGAGAFLDISILESLVELQDTVLAAHAYSGFVRRRMGANRESNYPGKVLPTSDGDLYVHAADDREWENLLRLIGREDLVGDPRFTSGPLRVEHAREVDAAVIPWLALHRTEDAYRLHQEARVSSAAVNTTAAVRASRQLASRGFFQEVEHRGAGRLSHPGPPFQLSNAPATIAGAPRLGEHTTEILAGLGLSSTDVTSLTAAGVI